MVFMFSFKVEVNETDECENIYITFAIEVKGI